MGFNNRNQMLWQIDNVLDQSISVLEMRSSLGNFITIHEI